MKRRRTHKEQPEEELQLNDVLEPETWEERQDPLQPSEEFSSEYQEMYRYNEYEDEEEEQSGFRIAYNFANGVGILIGVAVILILATLLISVLHWLGTDISQFITFFGNGLK